LANLHHSSGDYVMELKPLGPFHHRRSTGGTQLAKQRDQFILHSEQVIMHSKTSLLIAIRRSARFFFLSLHSCFFPCMTPSTHLLLAADSRHFSENASPNIPPSSSTTFVCRTQSDRLFRPALNEMPMKQVDSILAQHDCSLTCCKQPNRRIDSCHPTAKR
jgi:hypothetical protein